MTQNALRRIGAVIACGVLISACSNIPEPATKAPTATSPGLWQAYEQSLKKTAAKRTRLSPASDIEAWETKNGFVPEGSVVMVRSDWSKSWSDLALARQATFPGVSLAALKFLHVQRHILFHGHEPLDTDTTPTLEGEHWLMHNGYAQAEGVANLDKVAETGCLVAIGYPKFQGGLGGDARYGAICPPDWKFGVAVGETPEAPLPRSEKTLQWDKAQGVRIRK